MSKSLFYQEDLKRIKDFFEKREEVVALYLFGSYAKGYAREDSDIDIAVLLYPEFVESAGDFREEYYIKTLEFSSRIVDIVILNTVSPALKFEVFKYGKLLFDKNPEFRKQFLYKSLLEYYDYLFIEKIYFSYVKKRLKEKW